MLIPKQPMNSMDVAGFNNKRHLDSLSAFVKQIPEQSRVLEIGVGFGGSTWELLDSLPEGCELHSCDTFGMNRPDLKQKHINGVLAKHSHNSAIVYQMHVYAEQNHRAAFDWAVKQHPRYRRTMKMVHSNTSLELLADDLNWECVYIDGLHSYENVSAELSKLTHVKYLCGDDYHPAHEGCMRAIDEFLDVNAGRTFQHDPFDSGSGFWYSVKEE